MDSMENDANETVKENGADIFETDSIRDYSFGYFGSILENDEKVTDRRS